MATVTVPSLTDELAKGAACPGPGDDYYREEGSGFALRVRPSTDPKRGKSWVFLTTKPGTKGTFKITLGKYPGTRAAKARQMAENLASKKVEEGVDLIAHRRERKETAKAAARIKTTTVGALLAEDGLYERSLKARQYKNTATALSALRRNLLPAHKSTDIKRLERSDILTAMDKLTAQGKPGAAQDLRKHASTFLAWCADTRHLIPQNVMSGYRKQRQTKMERINKKSKRRALPEPELRAVWQACAKTGIYGQLFRMIILGGPRRAEPTHLEWGKHVLKDRVFFEDINTKQGREHAIPRTALVDAVLDDAKRFQRASSDLVFPSWKVDGAKISGFSQLIKTLIKIADVPRFAMHDLRRTCRTYMSKCDWPDVIQRLAVGQAVPHIDQIYNLHTQWEARKACFESYHRYLAAVIAGKSATELAALAKREGRLAKQYAPNELLARLAALQGAEAD